MNAYNPNIHHRRSIRLKDYDYSRAGLYFITIILQNREHLFGEVIDGKMKLNLFGKIAYDEWEHTQQVRNNIAIHDFIIMPDHMHGIIEILFKEERNQEAGKFKSPAQAIGSIVRGYKIATIKRIKDTIRDGSLRDPQGDQPDRGDKGDRDDKGELQFAPNASAQKIIQLDYKIWQRNYHEHIIRDEPSYYNIAAYIQDNPAKWHLKNR